MIGLVPSEMNISAWATLPSRASSTTSPGVWPTRSGAVFLSEARIVLVILALSLTKAAILFVIVPGSFNSAAVFPPEPSTRLYMSAHDETAALFFSTALLTKTVGWLLWRLRCRRWSMSSSSASDCLTARIAQLVGATVIHFFAFSLNSVLGGSRMTRCHFWPMDLAPSILRGTYFVLVCSM